MVAGVRGIIALWLLILSALASAAQLRVTPERFETELGKALTAKIIYLGDIQPDEVNLERWQNDFYIDRRGTETEQLEDGQTRVIETLRLFPRRAGELTLYSLALGGAISEPVGIRVIPAVRNGIDGTPTWQPLPDTVWQGETLTSCVQMALFDQRNNMKIERPEFSGFNSATIESNPTNVSNEGVVEQCWRLTAVRSGYLQLELPPVIQRGRGQWSFFLPKQHIEVLPLPSYLPPGVPIGQPRVAVRADWQYWYVGLQLNDPDAPEVYGLRAGLASASGIDSGVDSDRVEVQMDAQMRSLGIEQQFRAPLPDWLLGVGDPILIQLRYFDTQVGMLKRFELHLPRQWRAPVWFKAIMALLLALLLLVVALRVGLKVGYILQRWRARVRFKNAVRQAKTPEQLRQTLLHQAAGAQTLQVWAGQSDLGNADAIASELNRLCFARDDLSKDRLPKDGLPKDGLPKDGTSENQGSSTINNRLERVKQAILG